MPEIKHNFMKGKMNKDLDERLVPNGEYRDALNVQVSTSEGSDVGAVQNILGNSLVAGQGFISNNATCVGSIADEKNDKMYYFVTSTEEHIVNGNFQPNPSGWTVSSGWTYYNGKMHGVGVPLYGKINQSNLPIGKFLFGTEYEVSFTVSSYTEGNLNVRLYNENGKGFSVETFTPENKRYTFKRKVGSKNTSNNSFWERFWIQSSNPNVEFSGRIDDISVTSSSSAIVEYDSATNLVTPVFVDLIGGVLDFKADNPITGINIIDDLLFWTDNATEPRKINITRSKAGTDEGGLVHTDLIVEGLNEGLIKKEHITVIKKSPSKPPKLNPAANINSGYVEGIMKTRPYFYPPGENSNGLNDALVEQHHEMWIGFSTDALTGHNPTVLAGDIINVYRSWNAPNYDVDTPIARLLVKEVNNSGQQFKSSQIQNNFDPNTVISWSTEVAVKVAVSKVLPHAPTPSLASPQYYFQFEQGGKGIFERKLPRFAYRYKYEDNEYSSVGPFSEVVFIPGIFRYHPTEAYNKGMINNLKELTLTNFVTADIPEDVVQIDLLYKNEFSPSIYVVKTIDKNKVHWGGGGEYTITTENIYAQLPSNQLLRPWDNVPKKALAQEVTGNRIVYGNYFQNYNLINEESQKITPDLTASLDSRFEAVEDGVGKKSIKSQRTYNFGIVYGDEYGRETPVFTNEGANQLVTKVSSADSSAITINVNNDPPVWADYYKIFIKETSNEYYNLAMGRMYDAEDGNVWLSFPSVDRNKVDEDTYLVLKKASGDNGAAVVEDARYKVVAIENEAPDYIKTTYESIAEPSKPLTAASIFGGHDLEVSYPASLPLSGTQDFTIRKSVWTGSNPLHYYHLNMPDMKEFWDNEKENELYVSFSNVDKVVGLDWNSSPVRMSKKYKVVSIEEVDAGSQVSPGYSGGAMHRFKISEVIPASDSWYTDNVNLGNNTSHSSKGGRLKPHFYKKIVENKPEFDGRFFVKIDEDGVIKKQLSTAIPPNEQGFKVDAVISQLYYIADEAAPTIALNEGTTSPTNGAGTAAQGGSRYRADWRINIPPNESRWFIDAAAFAGSQPLDKTHPKWAEPTQESVDLSDISSEMKYITYNSNTVTPTIGDFESAVYFTPTLDSMYNLPSSASNPAWVDQNDQSVGHYSGNRGYQIDGADIAYTGVQNTALNPNLKNEVRAMMQASGTAFSNYTWGTNMYACPFVVCMTGSTAPNATGWMYTRHYKSEIILESKNLGTKVSEGKAFLKGVHKASYSDVPSELADITTNGGYDVNGQDFYLHLSFGGVGPNRSTNTSNHSLGLGKGSAHKASYWNTVHKQMHKNWNIGTQNSQLLGGSTIHDNEEPIVSNLTFGKLFRLRGDNNIYKIKSVTKRKLYNHQGHYNTGATEWFNDYEAFMLDYTKPKVRKFHTNSPSGGIVYNGVSAANPAFNVTNQILPSDMIDAVIDENHAHLGIGSVYWRDTSVYGQHDRMIQADNCRLSYLIKYEVLDSTVNSLLEPGEVGLDLSQNSQFNTTTMNTVDFAKLEFVSEYSTNVNNLLTTNPAIFETEPKEDVGLDIYYEATGKIPTNTLSSSSKVQNLIHVGATLSITPATAVGAGTSGTFVNYIEFNESNGYWYIKLSTTVSTASLSGDATVLKFHNDDGSYATATWVGSSTGNLSLIKVIIHPNTIGLGWFNCWSFGNGVESNRIGDTYNKPYIANGVKVSTTLLDSYKEEHRKYGLIYSGIYNSTSGVNDLNQFIAAEKITKDINPSYGSIQKLHSNSSADGDLITLCEDRVLKILANKDALYNADGNPQLIATNNVLGQAIPFSGEYGISTDPDSFASESYRVYFTDKIRGVVMRLSKDGLTPISNHGMKDWFRDNLKLTTKFVGSYDDRENEYNITLVDRKVLGKELIINGKFEVDPIDDWIQSGNDIHWVWDSFSQNIKSDGVANHKVGQYFLGAITFGQSYEISYTVGGNEPEGRVWVTLHNDAGGYKVVSPSQGTTSPGKQKANIAIDYNFIPWSFSGNYENSIQFHTKNDGVSEFNGTIDNVSVREIITDPKTVSFKENVRGWSSFKSFVPEDALSLANDYYSMVDGRLYKHHDESVNRNKFYGVNYSSSVNVLLNDSPGIIKTFHALNYEGSQSRVDQYVEIELNGMTYNNQESYNSTAKDGWFVSSIVTDKQEGSLTEFVEKEGKWFNYIKGVDIHRMSKSSYPTNELSDFGAFDLQGIGEVSYVALDTSNPDGSQDLPNYNA